MAEQHEPKGFFEKPENISKMLLVVADFIVHRHIYHSWENIPVFYAIYGFVGCSILVFIAKWMRTFLMRSEDYYDE